MNIKLIRAGITLSLAVIVLLPYVVSATAVIDLAPVAMAATTTEPVDPGVPVVETRFNETGKFLALMPLKFAVNVRINPDGRVVLGYPWYSKLTVDRRETLVDELRVAVDNALRALTVGKVVAEGDAKLKDRFSTEEAAAILAAVNRVLEHNFGTEEAR